ncbi:MAG: response regulator [Elusimicrobiota bacterium]
MGDDRLKILVVDDEMYVRLIVKAYLSPYKVEIIEAVDGKEGLDILREDYAEIDLVILDNTMPMMTGQEVLDEMNNDENLGKIPVIVYTAGGIGRDLEAHLKVSSSAFLEKSNLGDDLIPTIKGILGDRLENN